MAQGKKIRVLIAKPGLDGHDKGAIILSSRLRDAGMEVIYTGLRRTADQIVSSAIQEDVDVIGLSILSGAHLSISERVLRKMKEEGIDDRLLLVGGVIPDEDIARLKEMGVAAVFTQNSSYQEIIEFIEKSV
jgi:methylmalonyl-CoA mutase C-terminal domain/subunit